MRSAIRSYAPHAGRPEAPRGARLGHLTCALVVLVLAAAGCRQESSLGLDEIDREAVGRCAVDPTSGAQIGVIVGVGIDPDVDRLAYRVLPDTAPAETTYVGSGVRVLPCGDPARPPDAAPGAPPAGAAPGTAPAEPPAGP